MAMDQLTTGNNELLRVTLTKVPLCRDKGISLVRGFQLDFQKDKKYMKTALILVGGEIVTSNYSDTVHFMEELNLYDFGNDQNKYLDIKEFKNTKNLRLKLENETVYITKSECKAIYKLFNSSLAGYSLASVLEFEYDFTAETLTRALNDYGYLEIER